MGAEVNSIVSKVEIVAGEEHIKEKSYVFIEFWATWCAPCVAQIPHVNELNKATRQYNVTFISLSDEKTDKIKSFLNKKPINGVVAVDTNRFFFKKYDVKAIPKIVILSPEGALLWQGRANNLSESQLKRILQDGEIPETMQKNGVAADESSSGSDEGSASTALYKLTVDRSVMDGGAYWSSKTIGENNAFMKTTIENYLLPQIVGNLAGFPRHRVDWQNSEASEFPLSVTYINRAEDNPGQPGYDAHLLTQLASIFSLDIDTVSRPDSVYYIKVVDRDQLNLQPNYNGSKASYAEGIYRLSGVTLDQLADYICSELKLNVAIGPGAPEGYGTFEFEGDNLEEVKMSLRTECGITLTTSKERVDYLLVR